MARGRPRDEHRRRLIAVPHVKRSELEDAEEAELKVTPITPEPPDWLAGYAKEEWWRVAAELHRNTWLTSIDETLFARYCQAYARWRQAEDQIDIDGQTVKSVDKRNGYEWQRENPAVKIAMRWGSEMQKCAERFGLTPGSRRGWTVPKVKGTPHERLLKSIE